MKDYSEISTLITRFFDGETTLQEERMLYDFFRMHDDVPPECADCARLFRAMAVYHGL